MIATQQELNSFISGAPLVRQTPDKTRFTPLGQYMLHPAVVPDLVDEMEKEARTHRQKDLDHIFDVVRDMRKERWATGEAGEALLRLEREIRSLR